MRESESIGGIGATRIGRSSRNGKKRLTGCVSHKSNCDTERTPRGNEMLCAVRVGTVWARGHIFGAGAGRGRREKCLASEELP